MASTDSQRPDEFIGEQGLEERYSIPPRTAQRWRSSGDGPRWIRLGRRRILYRVSDVEEWLNERTFRHRAEELACAIADAQDCGKDGPTPEQRVPARMVAPKPSATSITPPNQTYSRRARKNRRELETFEEQQGAEAQT